MKFRHEYKHQINLSDIYGLRTRLAAVLERDSYVEEDGTYFVKSLYFDNYMDKALREKVDGVKKREKFRIRYYETDYGKESGYVKVMVSQIDDRIEIVVADNGVGILEEHIDKIWTRFYRVDDVRNDEYGSSGLGLAMVKSIIELHGGEVMVESNKDVGTEFRIVL